MTTSAGKKVSMVILVCERWAQWSETRWARFGRSGRLFLWSLCVGIDGAIQVCYDGPECSNYYLSGFKRADAQVRLVVAVGAFAIRPIENFILQMLAGDRLLRRSEELHEAVLRDMQDIIEMPQVVLERVARILDISVAEFHTQVQLAMCVDYGFLVREVYQQVWEEPLSLTQGCIEEKMAEVARRDKSSIKDQLVLRMRNMMDTGAAQEVVVQALTNLRDAPASTALVEEGHACGAVLMKDHDRYSETALRARALLYSLRPCVRQPKVDKLVSLVEKALRRIDRMQPNRITGRHMHLKTMVATAMTHHEEGDKAGGLQSSRNCVAKHAEEYASLVPLERASFDQQARGDRLELQEDLARQRTKLVALQRRLQDEEEARLLKRSAPNHVAEARLNDAELAEVCEFYDSKQCQQMRLEKHIGAFGSPPEAPAPDEQRLILQAAEAASVSEPLPPKPWLCRTISQCRDHFWQSALSTEEDSEVCYLFLFAKQSPIETCFMELRRKHVEWDLADPQVVASWAGTPERRLYEFMPPVVHTERGLAALFEDSADVYVRTGMMMHNGVVASPHAPMPLEVFLSQCPLVHNQQAKKRGGGARRPRVGAARRAELLQQFPWLSEEDLPDSRPGPRMRARTKPNDSIAAEGGSMEEGSQSDASVERDSAVVGDGDVAGLARPAEVEAIAPEAPEQPGAAAVSAPFSAEAAMEELAEVRGEFEWLDEDPLYFYTRVPRGAVDESTQRRRSRCVLRVRSGRRP